MEVTASKVNVQILLQVCTSHQSPVHVLLLVQKVCTLEGVTGVILSILLHFIFYVVVSSSYRYHLLWYALQCTSPAPSFFFFLYFGLALGFFSYSLVSGKVICFMACSSCVCVCVQELCVGFGWLTFLQYLIKVLQWFP